MDSDEKPGPWWQILLLIEGTLLAIALVTPITPGKTGSNLGLAHLFVENPSYIEDVAVGFLALHVLLLFLGIVFVLYVRAQRERD